MEKESRYNLDIATVEQKEKIKEIEALSIGAIQKAELVLVLLGIKNATDLTVYKWNDSSKKVEEILTDSKLIFKEIPTDKNNKKIISKYAVSLTQENADKLANLDPSKDHREYGEMMGFPQTAVDAFVNSTKLDYKDYPDMRGIVFNFALSRDNWQEEVERLSYWSQLIKKYSPKLFAELGGE